MITGPDIARFMREVADRVERCEDVTSWRTLGAAVGEHCTITARCNHDGARYLNIELSMDLEQRQTQ